MKAFQDDGAFKRDALYARAFGCLDFDDFRAW